mmetsp:Transcript_23279/g.48415  ORF Transcript_23279/g.48415 Transcript_23279/m.48415 type:complete len:84 (+) Transcript_23279:1142-1393(+)
MAGVVALIGRPTGVGGAPRRDDERRQESSSGDQIFMVRFPWILWDYAVYYSADDDDGMKDRRQTRSLTSEVRGGVPWGMPAMQ